MTLYAERQTIIASTMRTHIHDVSISVVKDISGGCMKDSA